MDKSGGNAREMIADNNSSLRSGNFVRVGDKRTSPTSYMRTFECAGLSTRTLSKACHRRACISGRTFRFKIAKKECFLKQTHDIGNKQYKRLV